MKIDGNHSPPTSKLFGWVKLFQPSPTSLQGHHLTYFQQPPSQSQEFLKTGARFAFLLSQIFMNQQNKKNANQIFIYQKHHQYYHSTQLGNPSYSAGCQPRRLSQIGWSSEIPILSQFDDDQRNTVSFQLASCLITRHENPPKLDIMIYVENPRESNNLPPKNGDLQSKWSTSSSTNLQ